MTGNASQHDNGGHFGVSNGVSTRHPPRLGWLAVFHVAAVAAYASAIRAPFEFDDLPAIQQNQTIRSLSPAALLPPAQTAVAGRPLVNVSLGAQLRDQRRAGCRPAERPGRAEQDGRLSRSEPAAPHRVRPAAVRHHQAHDRLAIDRPRERRRGTRGRFRGPPLAGPSDPDGGGGLRHSAHRAARLALLRGDAVRVDSRVGFEEALGGLVRRVVSSRARSGWRAKRS